MKSLLITGGTGHLGHAVLERFSREYRCLVATRTEFPKVETIYGVLHLAGAFNLGSSIDDFSKMLDANLMSGVRAIEAVREKIEEGGRIVAISSMASKTTPAGLAAYAAAKSALNAYIEVLAKELQPRRITANALLPNTLGPSGIPYQRVAETIAFLLSDTAAAISGQLLVMSG